ncbi:MAG: alpha/beta hydrolase [Oribacterium sp.]|nr:alpha/beta hydrolase [Oribacterium sp.]
MRGKDTKKDEKYGVIVENLEVKKENGQTIRGIIYRPDAKGQFPVSIFSHGFGANYQQLKHHGNGYAENGIVCVFFDFCGGGMESTSDGTMLEMTVMTEAADLVAVFESVKCLSYVDSDAVYLQGESKGGFVSAIVGRAYTEDIKGLILWYPAFVIPDDSKRRLKSGETEVFGVQLSSEYDKVATEIDVEDLQTGFGKPVLIIHGNKDDVVPIEYSRTAAANYGYATLKEVKGAGHGFDGKDSDMAREASIAFIKVYEGITGLELEA